MNTESKPIWILVANSAQARVFKTQDSTAPWHEIADFSHSEARLHERDLDTDVSGRNRTPLGGGHVFDEIISPKEQENIYFANQIAHYLHDALNQNQFGLLYVVSAPEFLGQLRQLFGEQLQKQVVLSVDKNLVTDSVQNIRAHLPLALGK
ncbi:host attachment protein [Thiomicrorhabdus aquaedulcis]|uniref:host attachment protein n=1 Tax=Thiomicrorhabdus aquaedulcis TaxID=2211106 RepID=UPI001562ABA9|nr:host attachment protein [Thiomicrorhabdus aquaedulcis]